MQGAKLRFEPWWWEAAPPAPPAEAPTLPRQVDVVVVGAGFCGLSAALGLARAGREVLVLEAGAAGSGASTRNGGQVGSGNQKFAFETLVQRYGEAQAQALVREGVGMLDYTEAFIRQEGIDCHFQRCGRFRGAVLPRHYARMERELELWRRRAGVRFEMVPPERMDSEIRSPRYHGGALLPDDAGLHPGLFHRGLLERVRSAGGRVIEYTPVLGLEADSAGHRVNTTRGGIRAREVLITTNGYTGRATPALHARTVPVGSAMIATEALDPARVRALMPGGRVYGETLRVFHYFRASPDGRRILFGGRVGHLPGPDDPEAYAHLYRMLVATFPELAGVGISHCWSGCLGFTHDGMPHIGRHAGLWYALGYNGSGVSRSTWFGHKVALKILGRPEGATAFDALPFKPFKLRFAAPVGVLGVESLYRVRDALDARTADA